MLSRLSPFLLWVLLALPAFAFLNEAFTSTHPKAIHKLLHPTGEFGVRLLLFL